MAAAAPKAAAPEGVQSELGAGNQFSVRRQLGLARVGALSAAPDGWCGYCCRYLFNSCLRTFCMGCRRFFCMNANG